MFPAPSSRASGMACQAWWRQLAPRWPAAPVAAKSLQGHMAKLAPCLLPGESCLSWCDVPKFKKCTIFCRRDLCKAKQVEAKDNKSPNAL